jgi:2'-5' RNA ligase
LFVALDLPERVLAELAAWQAHECVDPALRALPAAQVHMTLCFLGWQPEKSIDAIAAEIAAVAPRPVEIRLEPEPVGRPPGRRPRLYALDAASPAAVTLQVELQGRLERFYEPEKRPFWPHVTAARVRPERAPTGRRRRAAPRAVERVPGPLPASLLEPFFGVRVRLYRSHLRRAGAEYAPLADFDLPPG